MRITHLVLSVALLLLFTGAHETVSEPPPAAAAFPGGNGKLLVRTPSGLATVDPDGSNLSPLGRFGSFGRFSPDGTKIVFDDAVTRDIVVINTDGTNAQVVAPGQSGFRGPVWSPDGTKIAFLQLTDDEDRILTINADGTGLSTILTFFALETSPAWSPDGLALAFKGQPQGTGTWDIYSVGATGGVPVQLTDADNNHGIENELDFSPDGAEIAFSYSGPNAGIYVMPSSGGAAARVTTGSHGGPRWSPDGSRIAYTEIPVGIPTGTVFTMQADGTDRVAVTLPDSASVLDWQPVPATKVEFTQGVQVLQSVGGLQESLLAPRQPFVPVAAVTGQIPRSGRILFVKPVGPKLIGQTFSIDGDGTNPRQITNHTESTSTPTWSPDGERIAFFAYVDPGDVTTLAIFTQSSAGGGATQVTPHGDGVSEVHPHWSPLGDRILYIAWVHLNDGSRYDAHVMNPDGSGDVTVAMDAQPLAWSPDGSQIAYRDKPGVDDTLWVMNADGSGKRLISGTKVGGCDWSVNGETLACFAPDAGLSGIKLVDVATGVVTPIRGDAHSPVWSPTGDEIAFFDLGSLMISVMKADGSDVRALIEGAGPYDWIGPSLLDVELTQGVQELQSISALQGDLKGDGEPPVPIIAGKPAAMRVLFDEVQQAVTYRVEVSGEFTDNQEVTLTPGCTQEERRGEESGCRSVDFYFVPPQGKWSVTLKVKEPGGAVVESHTFDLESRSTDRLVLAAAAVCDQMSSGTTFICEDPLALGGHLPYLRSVMPARDVTLRYTGNWVTVLLPLNPSSADLDTWWATVVEQLEALFWLRGGGISLGAQEFSVGAVRPSVGGLNGMASDIPGRGVALLSSNTVFGQENAHTTFAHELAHAMGVKHTNVLDPAGNSSPACWSLASDSATDWPYADNRIQSGAGELEVGFDVMEGTALPGDEYLELMGYCAPRWASPRTYNGMLETLSSLVQPPPFAPRAAGEGPSWLVRGVLDEGVVDFAPLVSLGTEATAAGAGEYTIEVRDGSEGILYQRSFDAIETGADVPPGREQPEPVTHFAQPVPVTAGAAAIVVLDGADEEIGRITLGGSAPVVEVGAAVAGGQVDVGWSVTDPDSASHTYVVQYSADGGEEWSTLAVDFDGTSLKVGLDELTGSNDARFRVVASDGVNSGEAVSAAFSVPKGAPEGEITAPGSGAYHRGRLVWLQASALDREDGFLDGTSITWSSSLDGNLGTGGSLPVTDLSVGTHTITMTAKDSDNNVVTDSITVTVFDGPIVEGQVGLSGDVDCSGSVNSIDALKLSRSIAGLSVAQTEPCPDIGTGDGELFGDVNCDGHITAVDTLFVLRFVAALPVNVPQGCRQVGT